MAVSGVRQCQCVVNPLQSTVNLRYYVKAYFVPHGEHNVRSLERPVGEKSIDVYFENHT
jgi:hypothetical protein